MSDDSSPVSLFVDDSGNTGSDLLNVEQPFGATAMLLVNADAEAQLAQFVSRFSQASRAQMPQELKFVRLIRTAVGREWLRELFQQLGSLGVRVFFSLTEKRFLASALLVETFLDPLTCPDVDASFLHPPVRRTATNLVSAVATDGRLGQVLSAMAQDDFPVLSAEGRQVAALIALHPHPDALWISDALRRAAHSPIGWQRAPDDSRPFRWPAAHSFTFVPLLSEVDAHLRTSGEWARLVLDEDRAFGPVMVAAVEEARNPLNFVNGTNGYGVHGPLTRIAALEQRSSEACLGIQFADLLAGALVAVAKSVTDPQSVAASFHQPLTELLGTRLVQSFWQCSEPTLARLHGRLGRFAPPLD